MPNEEIAEGSIRVQVKCPFCDHTEEVVCPEGLFDVERFHAKQRAGCHVINSHPERIYEIAVVMAGPFQEFVKARVDGARREGQSLTPLQKAAKELLLPLR